MNPTEDTLMALVLSENGNMTLGRVPRGLHNIYEALGCSGIEGIRLKDAIMYIDDEGKFKKNPRMNKMATIIAWTNGLSVDDWIAGNAIIFGTVSPDGEYDGEDYDCPSYFSELFTRFCEVDSNELDYMMNSLRWGLKQIVAE